MYLFELQGYIERESHTTSREREWETDFESICWFTFPSGQDWHRLKSGTCRSMQISCRYWGPNTWHYLELNFQVITRKTTMSQNSAHTGILGFQDALLPGMLQPWPLSLLFFPSFFLPSILPFFLPSFLPSFLFFKTNTFCSVFCSFKLSQ